MSSILNQLHQDHINYSKLLGLLEENLEKMQGEQSPDYFEMSRILDYMIRYPDTFHHRYEDIIYDQVKNKITDKLASFEALSTQHVELADMGKALSGNLKSITGGGIVSRSELVDGLRSYLDLQRSHIDLEEAEILPVIRQKMTDADWDQIKDRLEDVKDPIFGNVAVQEFRDLYDRIMSS